MTESHAVLFEALRKNSVFTNRELERIAEVCEKRHYRKGQLLVAAGSILQKTHFVCSGLVIAYFIDRDGNEHLMQFATEGWWISDMASFVNGTPAILYVEAREDAEIFEFSQSTLYSLFEEIPKLESYFHRITQRAYLSFQERTLQTLSLPATERYLSFCRKYPGLQNRLPQKLIASYIGVTPEFLSRTRARLRREGK